MSDYEWITISSGRQKLVKKGEEAPERRRNAPGAGWPLTCCASGVHASQAKELRRYLADRGCPTEVTRGGDPVYRNASHQRRALRLRGMHNRNSYLD